MPRKLWSGARSITVVSAVTFAMVVGAFAIAGAVLWIWMARAPGQAEAGSTPQNPGVEPRPGPSVSSNDAQKGPRGVATSTTGLSPDDLTLAEVANATVMPKTAPATPDDRGPLERFVAINEPTMLTDALAELGILPNLADELVAALESLYPETKLYAGSHLRVLFAPAQTSGRLIPARLSIYVRDQQSNRDDHVVTVALTDQGKYVMALAPPEVTFAN